LKQRIVGAIVLLALAVIFLPMLFTRQDEMRHVAVEAPPAPATPIMPEIRMESVDTPQPQVIEEAQSPADPLVAEASPNPSSTQPPEAEPSQGAAPAEEDFIVTPEATTAPVAPPSAPPKEPIRGMADSEPATAPAPAPQSRLDANNLPVSWSIQLASLSNRASAENLQKTLRNDGYNAYIRTVGGMNRVFVGPVIERAEADKLRSQLSRQQKLDGFVVRFQPEQG
jgi:DedD protein